MQLELADNASSLFGGGQGALTGHGNPENSVVQGITNAANDLASAVHQSLVRGSEMALEEQLKQSIPGMMIDTNPTKKYEVNPHHIDVLPDGHQLHKPAEEPGMFENIISGIKSIFSPSQVDNEKTEETNVMESVMPNPNDTEAPTILFLKPYEFSAVNEVMAIEDLNELKQHLRPRELLEDPNGIAPWEIANMDRRFYLNRLNYIWIRMRSRQYLRENCQNGKSEQEKRICAAVRDIRKASFKIRDLHFRSMTLQEKDAAIQKAIPNIQHAIRQMVNTHTELGLALSDKLDWFGRRDDKFIISIDDIQPRDERFTLQPQLAMTPKIYNGIVGAARVAIGVIDSVLEGREQNLLTELYQSVKETLIALLPENARPDIRESPRAHQMNWIANVGVHHVNQAYGSLKYMVDDRAEIDPRVTEAMEQYYIKQYLLDDYEYFNRNLMQLADDEGLLGEVFNPHRVAAQKAEQRRKKSQARRRRKDEKRVAKRLAQESERAKKKAERASKKARREAMKNLRNAKSKAQNIAEEAAKNANKSAQDGPVEIIE